MSVHVIKTIHKVRFIGKYIEFWFIEDLKTVESHHSEMEKFVIQEDFHGCVKTYVFMDLLETIGMYSDVLTSGLKYRKTIWKRSEHNTHWEFVNFGTDTRMILIEKIK